MSHAFQTARLVQEGAARKLVAVADELPPGSELPFAWDEPTAAHSLRVTAQLRNFASHHHASGSERFLDIDTLPSKPLEPLVIRGSINPKSVEDVPGWADQDADAKARLEGALSEGVQRQVRERATSAASDSPR